MKKSVYNFSSLIRYRFVAIAVTLVCLVLTIPSAADVFSIDPSAPPEITLPPADAQRLQILQNEVVPGLMSPLSPNGEYVMANLSDSGMVFLNVSSGQKVPVSPQIYYFNVMTDLRWLNNHVLTYIGMHANSGAFHQVKLDRRNGELSSIPLDLPGYPLSLSNGADKVVLVQFAESMDKSLEGRSQSRKSSAPIKRVTLPRRFNRPGPAKFAYEDRLTVPVATAKLASVVYDLTTGDQTPLIEVPVDTALMAMRWSPRDHRLAVVRWKSIDVSRSGQVSEDSPEVQDALGNLPPEDNPYFTGNMLDLFHFRSSGVQHCEIHPEADSGEFFSGVDWDPNGMVFVAQIWTAGTPQGRTYPTFTHPNSSKYRFYLFNGRWLATLDRPEVDGLFGTAHMISAFDVLIHTAHELDFAVFRYNLFGRRLTRLSIPPGSVYKMEISSRRKTIVYNFSSYQQPCELYRLNLEQDEPVQVTHNNDRLRELNQVRADQVQFTLNSGAQRIGYLIQPADAAFPPDNVPVVVWQQGGPTAPMTQEWGGIVEMPFNLLPNFGFAVLVVPLPGRDGFGPEFLDNLADGSNFGQVDINEQVEIVDQMVARGYTSRGQTGVTGCSYGGYFTAQSVTSHSDTYAAANPQCTLLDLSYEWDMGYTNTIADLMGRTPDDAEEYYLDSPIERAELVQTPTLIFAGSEDFLPPEFSREFHDRISAVGTPVDYYEFIDEPHGLKQTTSQFVAGQAQLEWFRDYLLP